jgi:DNA-binding NtrC family response regulator
MLLHIDVIESECPLRRANLVARLQAALARRRLPREEAEVRLFASAADWRRANGAGGEAEAHLVFLHASEADWDECVRRCARLARQLAPGRFRLVTYTGGARLPYGEPAVDDLSPGAAPWWAHLYEVKSLRDFEPGQEDTAVEHAGRMAPPAEDWVESVLTGQAVAVGEAASPTSANIRHELVNAIEPLVLWAQKCQAMGRCLPGFGDLWAKFSRRLASKTDLLPLWARSFIRAHDGAAGPPSPEALASFVYDLERLRGYAQTLGRPKTAWGELRNLLPKEEGAKVLLIDDEDTWYVALRLLLEESGIRLEFSKDLTAVIGDPGRTCDYDAVVLDMMLHGYGSAIDEALRAAGVVLEAPVTDDEAGLGMLRLLGTVPHAPPVFVLSARESTSVIQACIQLGARGYLVKGRTDYLAFVIALIQEIRARRRQDAAAARPLNPSLVVGDKDDPLAGKLATFDVLAQGRVAVLLLGEPGVGKEEVARELHLRSGRQGPFVTVDCAAISKTLIESELFGHVRGAFNDARDRVGLLQSANGGTVFLDEFDKLKPDQQNTLLRFLQDQTFRRIGENQLRKVNVLVIGASNAPLFEGGDVSPAFSPAVPRRFVVLEVPPLRDRAGIVGDLMRHFCRRQCDEKGWPLKTFSPSAVEWVKARVAAGGFDAGGGNIGALQNLVGLAVDFNRDTPELGPEHLEVAFALLPLGNKRVASPDVFIDVGARLAEHVVAQKKGDLQAIEAQVRGALFTALKARAPKEVARDYFGMTISNFRKKLHEMKKTGLIDWSAEDW